MEDPLMGCLIGHIESAANLVSRCSDTLKPFAFIFHYLSNMRFLHPIWFFDALFSSENTLGISKTKTMESRLSAQGIQRITMTLQTSKLENLP